MQIGRAAYCYKLAFFWRAIQLQAEANPEPLGLADPNHFLSDPFSSYSTNRERYQFDDRKPSKGGFSSISRAASIPKVLLKRYRKQHPFHIIIQNTKLPPGPWKLPLLGSIQQLITREQTHQRFYRLAQKYGPLFHIKLGHVDFVVASSSSTAREVLKTHDHVLASRPTLLAVEKIGYNSSGIGFSPYGPYWRQLRKLCTQELLSTKKVKSLSFIRYEEAQNILYKIKKIAGSPVNLTEMFQEVSNMLITRTAIGNECKSRQRFILAMKETIKLLPMLRVADLFPSFSSLISFFDGSSFQMKRLRREMDHVLEEIIMEHKEKEVVTREMEEDLVDVLLRIQETGELQVPLTMDNVKAVILDMLVAATETTSNTMCWIMSELICHPEVMYNAQKEIREALGAKTKIEDNDIDELHYLHNVIKETLRLHPPLPLLLPRTCNEPTELCGFVIPKKARVVVNAWAIARDPKNWENPDNFYPERFDESTHDFRGTKYEYLPFGSGRRICPGTTFAMAEIELFISLLLLHFDWAIPGGKGPMELDMEEEFDGTARRKKDLYLIATTHSL
ncbi:hypothetical protein IEQ34_000514 [Dendrobium chrysotoxum]|uniref:Cytochrome P450 n=1 Tax=Dendrobium chrysotoxum TaxID=161865 RepID=A0AAV7HNR9_DENCH|nr:hypothetical protein IEQ34_000514 [Dendrobium chrysotoxum]